MVPRGAVRDWGGFRRRVPVGGFAKGIPLKDSTELPVEPMMVPAGEATVTVGVAARRSTGEPKARGRANKRASTDFMIGKSGDLKSN